MPLKWKKERLETAATKPPPEEEPLGPECTFQPTISETSKELAGSNGQTLYERGLTLM